RQPSFDDHTDAFDGAGACGCCGAGLKEAQFGKMLVELRSDQAECIIRRAPAVLQSERDEFVQTALHVLVEGDGTQIVEIDMDGFLRKLLEVGNEFFLRHGLRAIEYDVDLDARNHSANEIACHAVLRAYTVDGLADL